MNTLLANLASIVVYGPGFFGHSDAIQNAYVPWHWHMFETGPSNMLSEADPHGNGIFAEHLPADWVISLTNFFCRNLNNVDEEELYEPDSYTAIISNQVEQTVVAIDACIEAINVEKRDVYHPSWATIYRLSGRYKGLENGGGRKGGVLKY